MAVDERMPGPPPVAVVRPGSRPDGAGRTPGRTSTVLCLLTVLMAAAVSLVLKRGVPTFLNLSPYDGLLFARNATSLADGDWLGRFTDLTLVKGIGYPALMAFAHDARIELGQAEQLVYLMAALAVAGCILAATRRKVLSTGCFVFLALAPANFGAASNDVVRDNLYASLALLFVASTALLCLAVLRGARIVWIVGAGLLCGLSGAWAWVTREEGLSLVPPVLAVVVGFGVVTWRSSRRRRRALGPGRRSWAAAARPLIAVLVVGASFAAPLVAVAATNAERYGVALTDDMGSGTFLRAYADWTRVEVGDEQRRVPIDAAQRRAVYAVSGAARELAPYLERKDNPWRYEDCRTRPCEFGGGWMVWAIRDAAAEAGHFDDAREAQAFFVRLAAEIDGACTRGELTCSSRLPAGLQPVQRAPAGELTRSYGGMAGDLLLSRDLFEPVEVQTDVSPRTRAEYTAIILGLPGSNAAAAAEGAQYGDRLWLYEGLGAVYRSAVLALLAVALLGGIAVLVLRRRRPRWRAPRREAALVVLGSALAVGVLVRLGLLAIVDVAEYDAANGRYQLTSHVFLLAAVTVGAAGVVAVVRDRRRPGSVRRAVGGVDQAHREPDDRDLRASHDQHHAEDR
ncbi:hypothetical protein [Blastococcus sp. CT_GayMR16]|uniref:hypothetical protein n=1 Tax=Blastococcus sp. CT_GayMR16 TaxID=2559607 RepID=UPI001074408F|nr:hypothetical protein [Blastococcus sp. CT_GayMR16]TFV87792.1 hypothetical protein E4P38_12525 [Blastococcus sp. CT_GayMR16]